MPDADRPMPKLLNDDHPNDWNAAFAALPLETPPGDGWQRLSKSLDAATPATWRRTRWPVWLAAAATVSAVALVPVLMRDSTPSPAPVATATAPSLPPTRVATAPAPAATTPRIDPAPTNTWQVAVEVEVKVGNNDGISAAKRRKPAPTRPPERTQALPSTTTQTRIATVEPAAATTAAATTLSSLQAESAQLEALVALARDDRVASANGAALTGVLDERVARIDAALSQPGLDEPTRTGLWRQRVDALRELATVETTQRWLAAQGERLDGALVSVD